MIRERELGTAPGPAHGAPVLRRSLCGLVYTLDHRRRRSGSVVWIVALERR